VIVATSTSLPSPQLILAAKSLAVCAASGVVNVARVALLTLPEDREGRTPADGDGRLGNVTVLKTSVVDPFETGHLDVDQVEARLRIGVTPHNDCTGSSVVSVALGAAAPSPQSIDVVNPAKVSPASED